MNEELRSISVWLVAIAYGIATWLCLALIKRRTVRQAAGHSESREREMVLHIPVWQLIASVIAPLILLPLLWRTVTSLF
jgi:hypothetical protein